MIVKIPKMQYDTNWKDFFAQRNIQFSGETATDEGIYLKIVESPTVLEREEIEVAIIALGNKIYWSDDDKAGSIFDESVK